jgi:hypothetical protein
VFSIIDLQNAGLPVISTDGNDDRAITIFSRDLTPTEYMTYLTISDPVKAKALQARIDSSNATGYSTWTQAQFLTWYNANISPTQINAILAISDVQTVLLSMSAAIKGLASMIIANRDMLLWIIRRLW